MDQGPDRKPTTSTDNAIRANIAPALNAEAQEPAWAKRNPLRKDRIETCDVDVAAAVG